MAILRLEVKKRLLGRKALVVYLLAGAPVLLFFLRTMVNIPEDAVQSLGGLNVIFAVIFRTFFLRLIIFFGCVGIFSQLFRGDMSEKTLHYYFLVPVRREVLVIGKFVAGFITAGILFGTSVTVSFVLHYVPSDREFFLTGAGLGHLAAYVGVTVLACLGYGAVFLLLGLLTRNPIIPAGLILGWETINFLLPPALKKISVIYYLGSLCPVPLPPGPLMLLADPAPAVVAVPGLLLLTATLLFLSCLKLRNSGISYESD